MRSAQLNILASLISTIMVLVLLPSTASAFEIRGVGLQSPLSKAIDMLESNCQSVEHERDKSAYQGHNCFTNIRELSDASIRIYYTGMVFREVHAFEVWAFAGRKKQPSELLSYFRGNTRSYTLRSEWSCEKSILKDGYRFTQCEEAFTANGSDYKTLFYKVRRNSYEFGNTFSLNGSMN